MPEIIELCSDDKKTTAKVSTHGATVISWENNGQELLFLSKKAILDQPLKGIRGGIPVVFPNFGPWSLGPQHGFARSLPWKVSKQTDRSVVLELSETDYTTKMWPHKFCLQYTVKVSSDKLITSLIIKNTNETDEFDFTTLLHTYFKVPDIENTILSGFENCSFLDALTKENHKQIGSISIAENVDRIYSNTSDEHKVAYDNISIEIRKSGLPDTVVWNPWIEKAKAMGDFDDEEYKEMVCVEAGKVVDRHVLKADEVYQCEQVLTCYKEPLAKDK